MEEAQPEVEQAGRDRLAVDEHVALDEVPAPGPHHRHRPPVVEPVLLALRAGELEGAIDRPGEVGLAVDHVVPRGGVGVLEVDHEDVGAGVEGVDEHLGLGRAGDLHPPVGQRRRRLGHLPRTLPHASGLGQEVRPLAGPQPLPPLGPAAEDGPAGRAEAALEVGHEGQCLRREDGAVAAVEGAEDLDAVGQGGGGHGRLLPKMEASRISTGW